MLVWKKVSEAETTAGDSGRFAPLGNAGVLRCAQNDKQQQKQRRKTKATPKAGWEEDYIPTHRDETAMDGAPRDFR